MNAEEILEIPATEPSHLFSKDETESQATYRKLVKEWHPDINSHPDAGKVLAHIQKLYELNQDMIRRGVWQGHDSFEFRTKSARVEVAFKRRIETPVGNVFYGKKLIACHADRNFADLSKQGLGLIKNLDYPNNDVKDQISRFLPSVVGSYDGLVGEHLVLFNKTPDVFLLQDVLNYHKGAIPVKGVAWMVSAMLNLACYLQISKLVYNNFTTTGLFVSPKHHSICLLGNWWYAVRRSQKLRALPPEVRKVTPISLIEQKQPDFIVDLNSIRSLGLQLMGDRTGMTFIGNKDVPIEVLTFLRGVSSGDAIKDYRLWGKALEGFGKRTFVPMDVPESFIYKE